MIYNIMYIWLTNLKFDLASPVSIVKDYEASEN